MTMWKSLICLMVVLLGAGVTEATNYTWTGSGGSPYLWNTAANWSAGGPPVGTADSAMINNIAGGSSQWPVINLAIGQQTLGTLYMGYVAGTVGSPATTGLNISGKLHDSAKSFVANKAYTTGTININTGADVNFVGQMDLATLADTTFGILNINDGICRISQIMVNKGTGTINVKGGTLTNISTSTTSNIQIPWNNAGTIYASANGKVNLDSGLINLYRIDFPNASGTMDINDGTLRATYFGSGIDERTFDQYVAANQITAFNDDSRGALNVALDGAVTVVTASLSSPQQAWNPLPMGRAIPVTSNTLTWSSGAGATSHNVYVGTSFNAVNNATTADANIFKANRTAANYTFSGGQLGQTTYWRIDEVGGVTTKGNVWSFVIQANPIVEDFETYADTSALTASWPSSGGAAVTLSTTTVRGTKAMSLSYSNGTAGYSQATKTFAAQDWTASGLNSIDVYYYGNAANTADKIYMALTDGTHTAVQYISDVNAVKAVGWTVWHVSLPAFGGVTLTAVTGVKVGVGDPVSPVGHAATGTVYFDDLGLYGTRCLNTITRDQGDLNQDCVVDFKDFATMAGHWLLNGFFP